MRRREFIAGLGGAAAGPVVGRAQQPASRVRRIGVLINFAPDDSAARSRLEAFLEGLHSLGWIDGRNLQIDLRWAAGDLDRVRAYAAELVSLRPDVIFANGVTSVTALQRETTSIPIVFVQLADPVGSGIVANLARPGGTATGFTHYEYSFTVKWLELLKEIASDVVRVGIVDSPNDAAWGGYMQSIKANASVLGLEVTAMNAHDAGEVKQGIAAFSRHPHGGLVVLPSALSAAERNPIVDSANEHRLPAIYPYRYFALAGGLAFYGVDLLEQYRRAASYVDRILRGEKPDELPVQAPTKYELVINLKTAKALGLTVPPSLLARADEVIE
jgi:putative tryptophan/tyrosine transport system substrate-binding protein